MKLTNRQRDVLAHVPETAEGADWIADSMREETHWIASPLLALERKGMIVCYRRGGNGRASQWKRTPAGRAALEVNNG